MNITMHAKRRTGYGIFDISRQVARRVQSEWEMVEQPGRTPPSALTASVLRPLVRPQAESRPTEKRPLAA